MLSEENIGLAKVSIPRLGQGHSSQDGKGSDSGAQHGLEVFLHGVSPAYLFAKAEEPKQWKPPTLRRIPYLLKNRLTGDALRSLVFEFQLMGCPAPMNYTEPDGQSERSISKSLLCQTCHRGER